MTVYAQISPTAFTDAMYAAQTGKKLTADQARLLLTELDARRVKIDALQAQLTKRDDAPAVEISAR